MRRLWALGFVSFAILFVAAACGGGERAAPAGDTNPTPTEGPTTAARPAQESQPTPIEASSPTPRPSQESRSTPTSPPEAVLAPSPATIRYSWDVSTVDDNGAKPSLAVDGQGTPHIAYMLEARPGFVKHAVLGPNGWDVSTVSTGYLYGPLDIQVDDEGLPHISWHNHDAEDGAYATLLNGTWDAQNISHPGHDGWDINVAIDSKGRPHTISIDPRQFGSQSGVEYSTFDGTRWTVVEVGSGPIAYEFGTAIALDSEDRAHVAWFDDSSKVLKYAIREGGSWRLSTVDSEGDVGRFPSLALDTGGNPAISYYERTSATSGYIKVALWDGEKWDIQRVDKLKNVFLGFFGARKTSSLVLDGEDNPIIAYSDEGVVKLAWSKGSKWHLETVLTAGELPLGQQVSLALDNSGQLHLTFADVSRKGAPGVKGAIKYARGTPNTAGTGTPDRSAEATPTPESEATSALTVADPKAVPMVDVTVHSVPTENVIFDTFDGSFVRLSMASGELIEALRDAIRPIYSPGYGDATGLEWLKDGDLIIGYESEGGTYAYPIKVLNSRELVNDVIDNRPILVSYCPLCGSGVVYSRELDEETLLFGNTSALYESDLVMYDHRTGSYWFQVLGEAIVGEMTGKRLTPLAAMTISWGEWKRLHPDTRLLVSDGGEPFGSQYSLDPFGTGYSERLDQGRFPFPVSRDKLDDRLRASELVITVEVDPAAKAYPLGLIGEAAVNDRVGGQPVVIFSRGTTGSAFIARAEGKQLSFQLKEDLFVDEETGSTWNAAGRAVAGPLEGASLVGVPSRRAFWFSIAGAIPGLELYLP